MPDSKPPSPVAYAENTLDVHTTYTDAQSTLVQYEDARQALAQARTDLRGFVATHEEALREATSDGATEYLTSCQGSPEGQPVQKYSEAGRERYVKDYVTNNSDVLAAADQVRIARATVENLESQCDIAHRRLDLSTARLNELAGLLTFYAMRTPRRAAPPDTNNPNTPNTPKEG